MASLFVMVAPSLSVFSLKRNFQKQRDTRWRPCSTSRLGQSRALSLHQVHFQDPPIQASLVWHAHCFWLSSANSFNGLITPCHILNFSCYPGPNVSLGNQTQLSCIRNRLNCLQAVKELSLAGFNGRSQAAKHGEMENQMAAQTGLALAALSKKASDWRSSLPFPVWVNVLLQKLTQKRTQSFRRTRYSINWQSHWGTNQSESPWFVLFSENLEQIQSNIWCACLIHADFNANHFQSPNAFHLFEFNEVNVNWSKACVHAWAPPSLLLPQGAV